MSNSTAPDSAPDQAAAQVAPASAETAHVAEPHATAQQQPRPLSPFLKVSIALLAVVTIASISLLFIGSFDGKFERVFSTFALFAIFVLFTALDTRREQQSEWYAPVALIANAYILGLLLIVIWMTPFRPFLLLSEIFWRSLLVIVVTRMVILCCQWLISSSERLTVVVVRFAFVTSVLAVLTGILFTAPVAVEAFQLVVPDLYWKIATALLILTALGLSITLLLRWSYGADHRAAVKQRRIAEQQAAAAQRAQNAQNQQRDAGVVVVQQQSSVEQVTLLPWPTFADGRPLPALADGQPDFSVPGAPLPPQL